MLNAGALYELQEEDLDNISAGDNSLNIAFVVHSSNQDITQTGNQLLVVFNNRTLVNRSIGTPGRGGPRQQAVPNCEEDVSAIGSIVLRPIKGRRIFSPRPFFRICVWEGRSPTQNVLNESDRIAGRKLGRSDSCAKV